MLCPTCQTEARKFGKDRKGNQRFQCAECRKTFAALLDSPLGDMRLPITEAVACLRMLLEGVSVWATARLTRTNRTTILSLMVLIGERCERMLAGRVHYLPVVDVQCAEIWSFVGMKEKTRLRNRPELVEAGNAYCFIGIERETKLILAWHLGVRSKEDAEKFAAKLALATSDKFQVLTNGCTPYDNAIPEALPEADFAQLVKHYATKDQGKYSPGEVTGTVKTSRSSTPDEDKACTPHIEREKPNSQMQNRRITRPMNAFSMKWDNHAKMLALQFCYHNFCRVHQTLEMTPAMKAGLEDHPWTVHELVEKSARC